MQVVKPFRFLSPLLLLNVRPVSNADDQPCSLNRDLRYSPALVHTAVVPPVQLNQPAQKCYLNYI